MPCVLLHYQQLTTEMVWAGLDDDDYGNQVGKSGGSGVMTYQQALQKAQQVARLCPFPLYGLCFVPMQMGRSTKTKQLHAS